MFDNILTLDHAAYYAAGAFTEVAGLWAIARIKTLAKNPTASLSADALALIEKLLDQKIAAAKASATATPVAPTPTPAA